MSLQQPVGGYEMIEPAKDLFGEYANTRRIAANVAKWVHELLTTDRPQGSGVLCAIGRSGTIKGECCLGVWCRIAGLRVTDQSGRKRLYQGVGLYLPMSQRHELGLRDTAGEFTGGSLAKLNDDGRSFKEVGAFIRDSWLAQFGSPLPLPQEGENNVE